MTTPSAIQIFGQNRLDKYCVLSATSGVALLPNIYDQKPDTVWQSSGGNSDTVVQNVDISFKTAAGISVSQDFDTVILLNHNLKLTTAMLSPDGTNWDYITGWVPTFTAPNIISSLPYPQHTPSYDFTGGVPYFRLHMFSTQTANQEKSIGELKFVKSIATLNVLSDWKRKDAVKSGFMRMSDGSAVAWQDWQKVEGTLSLQNVSLVDKQAILAAIAANDFLTFAFFYNFDPTEIFEFRVVEPPQIGFDRKSQLYSLDLSLKER
ncbi:MAG: hypothetical protein PHP45_06800 [Elusimicrobiales bacterium]|nr:hypothetical protein [Elusimicrobiales bacterium]